MVRKEHPSSPNGKWFRKLFKRGDNAASVEERVEGSLEAASVSDNADKLLEAPREMVLPTLNPREHISVEAVEPPSAEVLETAVEPTWREKLKLGNRKTTESLSDSFATADMVVQRPIRLFIGYVPDVTEKDAKFFAMGVAEKNVDSEYISYMGLFKYGTGYAYEIQEGGHGHSYLTRILKYFSQLPPGLHDAETAVYVATASRMVQVEKTADGGLVCIQLPESYKAKETEWLRPEKKLKLLRDQNSGLMMVSGVFLGVSLLVLTGAFLTRYVPRENPESRVWYDTVTLQELPVSQWDSLIKETEAGHYILSLRYNGKDWCRKTEVGETCGKGQKASANAHAMPNGAMATQAQVPSVAASNTPAVTAPASTAMTPATPALAASHALPPLPPVPAR
jgi:hypothetical protein